MLGPSGFNARVVKECTTLATVCYNFRKQSRKMVLFEGRLVFMAVAESKKRIQVALPFAMWKKLTELAEIRGVSKSAMASIAISEFLEREEKK